MLLSERFFSGFGWFQIAIMSLLGGFVAGKMLDNSKISRWRTISWTVFSIVFFLQLILGLLGFEDFLMTGKLHLPIPAVVPGGAIFRMEFSFMPILFIITVLLTGPAWCSQLCYFGAFDNISAGLNKKNRKINSRNLKLIKSFWLVIFVVSVLFLRMFDVSIKTAGIIAVIFGCVGLLVVVVFSSISGKMIHCVYFCPLGTILNYARYINPFRMCIDSTCTDCMKCSKSCKYLALEKENIAKRKPGFTCTMCGDCLNSCHTNSIKYKFLGLSPERSRKLYVVITIAIYVVFLNVARI